MSRQSYVHNGTYRHSKSNQLYEVIGTAMQTETNQQLVIYRPLYPSERQLFARPLELFTETVIIDGVARLRFENITAQAASS